MAVATTNQTANVSAGKGVAGGYVFRAPLSTTKPTDYTTPLGAAFKCCGFITEDGVSFASDSDTNEFKDINGDTIDASKSSVSEKFTMVLAEIKAETQKTLYGDDNVTDADGLMTVHINGDEPEHYIWAFELLLKNGRKWRRVVHEANVTEMGDQAVASGDLSAREATLTAYKDATSGDYYTDYIQSTETTASGA